MRWNLSLLLCTFSLAACGPQDAPQGSEDVASVSESQAELVAHGASGRCGAPMTFGDLNPNDVTCHQPVVPVHVSGAFTGAVQIAITQPDANTIVGTMNRAGGSCNYQYQWELGHQPAVGTYAFKVSDANNVSLTFNVFVATGNHCQDGNGAAATTGAGTAGGGTNTGATTGGAGGATTGGTAATTGGAGATTGGAATGGAATTAGGAATTAGGAATTAGGAATTAGGASSTTTGSVTVSG